MKAVEMYYTVAEVSLLVKLHPKTVIEKLKAGAFGNQVVDLAKSSAADAPASHDYRIPASGVNGYLDARRVFSFEIGIAARTEGELRRKIAA